MKAKPISEERGNLEEARVALARVGYYGRSEEEDLEISDNLIRRYNRGSIINCAISTVLPSIAALSLSFIALKFNIPREYHLLLGMMNATTMVGGSGALLTHYFGRNSYDVLDKIAKSKNEEINSIDSTLENTVIN